MLSATHFQPSPASSPLYSPSSPQTGTRLGCSDSLQPKSFILTPFPCFSGQVRGAPCAQPAPPPAPVRKAPRGGAEARLRGQPAAAARPAPAPNRHSPPIAGAHSSPLPAAGPCCHAGNGPSASLAVTRLNGSTPRLGVRDPPASPCPVPGSGSRYLPPRLPRSPGLRWRERRWLEEAP